MPSMHYTRLFEQRTSLFTNPICLIGTAQKATMKYRPQYRVLKVINGEGKTGGVKQERIIKLVSAHSLTHSGHRNGTLV
jgi:hypothetical protein